LGTMGIITGHPPQSIYELSQQQLQKLLPRMNLGFAV